MGIKLGQMESALKLPMGATTLMVDAFHAGLPSLLCPSPKPASLTGVWTTLLEDAKHAQPTTA